MKVKRKIISIDEEHCDGCGQCVSSCAEGAIEVVDGKARMVAEKYCDGLGACLGECPNDALHIIEREADDFDEAAVEEYLKKRASAQETNTEKTTGCPSARLETFAASSPCTAANSPLVQSAAGSALTHWPVQIRLVPANAPFLRGAELLVAADCTPVAYPRFHQDLLQGKVVLLGCPKFDDVEEYVNKFTDIFKTANIASVTVAVMEVPCCSALPTVVRKAMRAADKRIPLEKVVITSRGEILRREKEHSE